MIVDDKCLMVAAPGQISEACAELTNCFVFSETTARRAEEIINTKSKLNRADLLWLESMKGVFQGDEDLERLYRVAIDAVFEMQKARDARMKFIREMMLSTIRVNAMNRFNFPIFSLRHQCGPLDSVKSESMRIRF